MHRCLSRHFLRTAPIALALLLVSNSAWAQYKLTRLDSNQPSPIAAVQPDPLLVNAWGLAFGPKTSFWISDNGSGMSTLYDGNGVKQGLEVKIPALNPSAPSVPTGIVFNPTQEFAVKGSGAESPAVFLFAGLDGSITGWSPTIDLHNAQPATNNAREGAVYTGLAISSSQTAAAFLFAADAQNNRVDVYDGQFNLVRTMSDPNAPKGFSVYNVQDIKGKVFVTYASNTTATGGLVDIFSESGVLLRRLVHSGVLNQPWGLALAPAHFGPFSGALLVGNNTPHGTIHAFDRTTGKLLGVLKDVNGKPIEIDQLWGLAFGGGGTANGGVNQLFFTAGPSNYANGLFGRIEFAGK